MLGHSLLRKFTSVRLKDDEILLFASLLEASDALGKNTVLRAAGGWVRDKLLGIESHDIDIALDNVPGDEFALFLHARVKAQESSSGNISSIGVVRENPNQSKHIRTATFKYYGFDIDINNLRSETYADDSRIPEVQFAKTPSEDAYRRDFTINALYYNLNSQEIEDYTGSGLDDLENGIIKTPLPAEKTFVDDPLRVLRAIRFAARFGFKLHPDITTAWNQKIVQEGLVNKVSRERIGTEVSKMMKGRNSLDACRFLIESGLVRQILEAPLSAEAPSLVGISKKDYDEWKLMFKPQDSSIFDHATVLSRLKGMDSTSLTPSHTYFMGLSLLFLDSIQQSGKVNPGLIARLSMKLSSSDSKTVGSILLSVKEVQSIVDGLVGSFLCDDEAAMQLGRVIRSSVKENFPVALRLAVAMPSSGSDIDVLGQLSRIEDLVSAFSLVDCHLWRPIVDGSEIARILEVKPGPIMQKLVACEFDLMFKGERDRDVIVDALRKFYSVI
jgi:tRNA nucleotidyltransferase (CCA-adding enzyme)